MLHIRLFAMSRKPKFGASASDSTRCPSVAHPQPPRTPLRQKKPPDIENGDGGSAAVALATDSFAGLCKCRSCDQQTGDMEIDLLPAKSVLVRWAIGVISSSCAH